MEIKHNINRWTYVLDEYTVHGYTKLIYIQYLDIHPESTRQTDTTEYTEQGDPLEYTGYGDTPVCQYKDISRIYSTRICNMNRQYMDIQTE